MDKQGAGRWGRGVRWLAGCAVTLWTVACQSGPTASTTDPIHIQFFRTDNGAEISTAPVTVASSMAFSCKATVEPIASIANIHQRIWLDYSMATDYAYTPNPAGTSYLIEDIVYNFVYGSLQGVVSQVRISVEAEEFNGTKHEAHLTFDVTSGGTASRARFLDFEDSATAAPGASVTIRPFYEPSTVNHTVKSMVIYRKDGAAVEQTVETLKGSDFFYYQTGYLREYTFTVPALPAGTTITHRFAIEASDGLQYELTHLTHLK